MPDTPEDVVKEARELLSKATPGPWKVYSDSRPDIVTLAEVNSGYMGERHLLSMDKYGESWGQDFENEDDANLIARAPELLASLCDEVERIQNAFLIAYDLAGMDAHPLPEALPESAYVPGYMDKVRELRAVYEIVAARVKKD